MKASLVLGLLFLSSCASRPTEAPLGDCVDRDPPRAVSFATDVWPLFERGTDDEDGPGCSDCHFPGGAGHAGYRPLQAELDLSTLEGVRRGGATSRGRLIIPGDPCASPLVQKLRGEYAPMPARMPLGAPRFWTKEEIQVVIDWIHKGARE